MDTIDKINFFLAKKGVNGADLSRALDLSNSTYSQWNKKKNKPSKKLLPKIAKYLCVSVEDLLPDPDGQEVQLGELPTNNQNEIIVENIRRIATRKNTNISQIEKALGFANGTIGKWANGHKSPPYDKLSKIAEHLQVSMSELTVAPTIPAPSEHDPGIKNPPGYAGGEVDAREKVQAIIEAADADKIAALLRLFELTQKMDEKTLGKLVDFIRATTEK